MYEKDFARRLSIHWCDLDKHEIVEAVGPENIAGSGLVEEADLTAAVAHVREMESCLAQSYENRDRLVTIIDEAFGLQCVQTPDEILSCLETNLTKMRLDATAAERERDEARAEIVARSESVMRQAETITGLRAKLAEEEMVSESWRIRIAAAVGAVHEWDYGSAPGTWEQIEDKAESDRKQADATLDEMIVYRDKCETLESRLTRYAALERAVREMHPGNWSPNVVHALDALTHAPSAPDDERGCPTCATLAGKIERLRAEVAAATDHVRALVAAMAEWGTWEDGVPAAGRDSGCGTVGDRYDAARAYLAAKGGGRA